MIAPADESDATDQSDPSEIWSHVLGFKSVPAFSANIGEKFQYRPLLDQDGSAEWSLSAGPDSAAFNESGILVWEPAEESSGLSIEFEITGSLGEQSASQNFKVTVAKVDVEAEGFGICGFWDDDNSSRFTYFSD